MGAHCVTHKSTATSEVNLPTLDPHAHADTPIMPKHNHDHPLKHPDPKQDAHPMAAPPPRPAPRARARVTSTHPLMFSPHTPHLHRLLIGDAQSPYKICLI